MALAAFKKAPGSIAAGAYGTCNCGVNNTRGILLQIKADHTFRYADKTISKSFDITGTWRERNGKVVLENYPAGVQVHRTWTLAGNENCIKSRHGMDFRRLCRVQDCD